MQDVSCRGEDTVDRYCRERPAIDPAVLSWTMFTCMGGTRQHLLGRI